MNDLRGSERLREAELDAARRVVESGWYVLGEEVRRFEEAWATTCETSYAVGVGNGLDAIEIGLRAAGLGPGDEVITTGMTAFATVLAVLRAGCTPVLADIDPTTAILDPESVVRCITPRTRAILVVHLYGRVGPLDELIDICSDHGLVLFEDCAQSHLARDEIGPAGSRGLLGAWSFYPTKNLGAIGDAGAITTSDANVAEAARELRNYGQSTRYQHDRLGLNSRLDELQAALLMVRLASLEQWTLRRRAIANTYREVLASVPVKLLSEPDFAAAHVHHLVVITVPDRARLQEHLRQRGVQTLVHYPIPVHQQEPCMDVARDPRGLANTEEHASSCLSLPCHPGLTDDDIFRVAQAVKDYFGESTY